MREIKFRVWIKHRKEMRYDNIVLIGVDGYIFTGCEVVELKGFQYGDSDENNYILMQYTGLKDRQGKEIYEGDVVRHLIPYEDSVGFSAEIIIIKWQTERFHDIEFNVPLGLGFNIEWEDDELVEVIGNVYENPELMKER